MKAVPGDVYFNVLDDVVRKYNNTVHRTIGIRPLMLHLIFMLNTMRILINNNSKFKVGDRVRLSKYKNISAKVFVISKIKNTVPWTYVISDLNGKETNETFYCK